MRIIHVEKADSDLGLVLSGGKGCEGGNVVISAIQPGRSVAK